MLVVDIADILKPVIGEVQITGLVLVWMESYVIKRISCLLIPVPLLLGWVFNKFWIVSYGNEIFMSIDRGGFDSIDSNTDETLSIGSLVSFTGVEEESYLQLELGLLE